MSIRLGIVAACAIGLSLLTGCTLVGVVDPAWEEKEYYVEDDYYVDAYVHIPFAVRVLISERVDGYTMPPKARYTREVYPVEINDPYNRPSYIRADFNGDDEYDYAYIFSDLEWHGDEWHLYSKLLIVTSTYDGYMLSLECDLGEVIGSAEVPVHEYWGIRLLEPGEHVVTWYRNGVEIQEHLFLEYTGVYLASCDPEERSVWYVEGNDAYEVEMDMGAVAKKKKSGNIIKKGKIVRLPAASTM